MNKRNEEVCYGLYDIFTGDYCICTECGYGAFDHSGAEKTENGSDRTRGWCEVSLKKAGTPTMGGVMILLSVVITSVFYIKDYPKIIPILFLTLGFGLIGFLDDYLKVVMKRSDGLYPKQKMALQIVVTAIFAFYMVKYSGVSLAMLHSVLWWKVSGYRLACDSFDVLCRDWYC